MGASSPSHTPPSLPASNVEASQSGTDRETNDGTMIEFEETLMTWSTDATPWGEHTTEERGAESAREESLSTTAAASQSTSREMGPGSPRSPEKCQARVSTHPPSLSIVPTAPMPQPAVHPPRMYDPTVGWLPFGRPAGEVLCLFDGLWIRLVARGTDGVSPMDPLPRARYQRTPDTLTGPLRLPPSTLKSTASRSGAENAYVLPEDKWYYGSWVTGRRGESLLYLSEDRSDRPTDDFPLPRARNPDMVPSVLSFAAKHPQNACSIPTSDLTTISTPPITPPFPSSPAAPTKPISGQVCWPPACVSRKHGRLEAGMNLDSVKREKKAKLIKDFADFLDLHFL